LAVAEVTARIVRRDPDFRSDALKPVLAALLHDAGMLGVPPAILGQATPFDDTQRRIIEGHTRLGSELVARLQPDGSWLADTAIGHHERLDGTGYPAGRKEAQLDLLTRLIAVCDVYAAMCTPRPHRPARDTRTALTDTLLLAEQGALDRSLTERLLQLSFYPVGSVVELADGAFGVVVATHMGRRDLASLSRPVLALLTDAQGRCLPVPQHIDLAECENRSIVRRVAGGERGMRDEG
jgi:HD-GYP domain-containing protein (c-di-GMP phosphodiesterase class II)